MLTSRSLLASVSQTDKMGIHNVGSRVSIKDETLNLNSVPSSARNKVFRRVKYTRGLVRDVCAELPLWSFILFPFRLITFSLTFGGSKLFSA